MPRIQWRFVLLSLILTFVLSACGSAAKEVVTQHIIVEAKEFSFSPATLTVKVGEPVEIEFKNLGSVEHDFNIVGVPITGEVTAHGDQHAAATAHDPMAMDNPVHVMANVDHFGHLIFTPSQAGEYLITCTVAGHKEAGMVGKLIVTP